MLEAEQNVKDLFFLVSCTFFVMSGLSLIADDGGVLRDGYGQFPIEALYIWVKNMRAVHVDFMLGITCLVAIGRDHWRGHIDWVSLATRILTQASM